MIKFSEISRKLVSFSKDTTANTRFTVAHGLGYAPAVNAIRVQTQSLDDDTTGFCAFAVVKVDGTNVTLKPSATVTGAKGLIEIGLEEQGPVNFGR